jgi:hypothetical protein
VRFSDPHSGVAQGITARVGVAQVGAVQIGTSRMPTTVPSQLRSGRAGRLRTAGLSRLQQGETASVRAAAIIVTVRPIRDRDNLFEEPPVPPACGRALSRHSGGHWV